MSSMESKTLLVKKAKNGKGLFVKKSFKTGQKIFEIKGKVVSAKKFMKLSSKIRNNAFRFDKELYLIPTGEFGDFLNHSCVPNCGVKKVGKKLFLLAVKDIKEGKELILDYSTILGYDDFWKMRCNCGNKSCRKVIDKFTNLPKHLQKRYLGSKVVPSYITPPRN